MYCKRPEYTGESQSCYWNTEPTSVPTGSDCCARKLRYKSWMNNDTSRRLHFSPGVLTFDRSDELRNLTCEKCHYNCFHFRWLFTRGWAVRNYCCFNCKKNFNDVIVREFCKLFVNLSILFLITIYGQNTGNNFCLAFWSPRGKKDVIMKPNAAKYSGCKARGAVWSNWAVKCSQVNRDFSSKYDIVCLDLWTAASLEEYPLSTFLAPVSSRSHCLAPISSRLHSRSTCHALTCFPQNGETSQTVQRFLTS